MLHADRMDELGSTATGRDGLRVIDPDRRPGRGRRRRADAPFRCTCGVPSGYDPGKKPKRPGCDCSPILILKSCLTWRSLVPRPLPPSAGSGQVNAHHLSAHARSRPIMAGKCQYETTGIAAKNSCFVCRRPQTWAYGLGSPRIRALLAERFAPPTWPIPVLPRAGMIG
jgi:hypothetical protein